jgi:hypothetical protein
VPSENVWKSTVASVTNKLPKTDRMAEVAKKIKVLSVEDEVLM